MNNVNASLHRKLSDSLRVRVGNVVKHKFYYRCAKRLESYTHVLGESVEQLEGSDFSFKSAGVHRNTLLALESFHLQNHSFTITAFISTGELDIDVLVGFSKEKRENWCEELVEVFFKEESDLSKCLLDRHYLWVIVAEFSRSEKCEQISSYLTNSLLES